MFPRLLFGVHDRQLELDSILGNTLLLALGIAYPNDSSCNLQY